MRSRVALVLLSVALTLSVLASACGSDTTPRNPPPRTPGTLTANEDYTTDAQAIDVAAGYIAGKPGSQVQVRNIQSVSYVRTTLDQAAALARTTKPQSLPPTAPTWLFVAHGEFNSITRYGPEAPHSTLAVLVVTGFPVGLISLTDTQLNLLTLGTPAIIGVGQVPSIDAVRAPGAGGPGRPPTPFPQFLSHSDVDAIRNAWVGGSSTGAHLAANISSVQWARASISAVNGLLGVTPHSAFGEDWSTQVWVFEFVGDFHEFNRTAPGAQNALQHYLYRIVYPNEPAPSEYSRNDRVDLSSLGLVTVIPRGANPNIDALRVPD